MITDKRVWIEAIWLVVAQMVLKVVKLIFIHESSSV